MPNTLLTSTGITIQIGRELGKGGEGSVYEIPAAPAQVAKLYHQLPTSDKQAKLSFMARTAQPQLLDFVAWPQATLHTKKNGPVVGFLMSNVNGRAPIHTIYNPAHRQQHKPGVAWDYLLYVARNTAAAFEALHAHGHVLGDVNQGNLMVGSDSKVVLIDSDSFQVNAAGSLHLCEVGVAHFTAPELQGITSFDGVRRTSNHDNFGLALLLFHLLFGGRHPYSGTPLYSGTEHPLETNIQGFRYAYSRDAHHRGIAPPPRAIDISLVPPSMILMFDRAFTEKGVNASRPTATQWVVALDELRSHLKKCHATSMHIYPDHLGLCPWCQLERQDVIYFAYVGAYEKAVTDDQLVAKTWASIDTIISPPQLSFPAIANLATIPRPLPKDNRHKGSINASRLVLCVSAIVALLIFPGAWLIILLTSWLLWNKIGTTESMLRKEEKKRRTSAEKVAALAFNALIEKVHRETTTADVEHMKTSLKRLHDEYQALQYAEKKAIENLHKTELDRQKQKFLTKFFIETADIPGLGTTRKSALRAFGIKTAADLNQHRIRQVSGFGEVLTYALISWRTSCEHRFVFRPSIATAQAEKNLVCQQFIPQKTALVNALVKGAADLQTLRCTALINASTFQAQINQTAQELAQSQSDLSIV